jgi:hypothetical protein
MMLITFQSRPFKVALINTFFIFSLYVQELQIKETDNVYYLRKE